MNNFEKNKATFSENCF